MTLKCAKNCAIDAGIRYCKDVGSRMQWPHLILQV